MMHQPRLRSLAAYVVCLTFLTTIASPLLAIQSAPGAMPDAVRTQGPSRVSVGRCTDDSHSTYGDLSRHLASAAQLALATSGAYGATSPTAAPGPDRVLHLTLQEISAPTRARPMQVRVAAELRTAASGELICSAASVSTGRAAPIRTAASSEALVRAAVSTGVQAVVAQVTEAAEITGRVISTSQRDKVRTDLGRVAGIKAGTELAIYRDGKYLATVEVRSVRDRESTGAVTDIKAGTVLRAGDDVRVVSIPAKPAKQPQRKSRRSALITGLVVLAGLGLLTAINSWGGHSTPVTNVKDPLDVTKTTILADGSDSVTITAIVSYGDGTPVRNGTAIVFRITAGRGELDGTATQVEAQTAQGAATVTLTTVDETSPPIIVTALPQNGTAGTTPPITVLPPP